MGDYTKETESYIDENGNVVEINHVTYERTDGKGEDEVEQTKINGVEVGHITKHPDGTIHKFGIYEDDKEKEDEQDDEQDDDYER